MRWIAQPAVQVGIRSRGQALGPQAAVGEQALFQGSDGTQAAGYAPTQGDLGGGELRRGEDLSLADVLQLLNPTASATRVGVGPRGGPRCARPSRAGGGPRMFAAATASWTAKLMPTPPTGSITCAASPSNNRPGRYQRGTRLASSGSYAVWTRSWSKSMRSASQGSSACTVTWTGSSPATRRRENVPRGSQQEICHSACRGTTTMTWPPPTCNPAQSRGSPSRHELLRDLAIRLPTRCQAQHLNFARAQATPTRAARMVPLAYASGLQL